MLSVPDTNVQKVDGEGVPRRHPLVGSGALISHFDDAINTLYENLWASSRKYGKRRYLGKRSAIDGRPGPYVWETYEQVAERVKNLAAGMRQFNLDGKANIGLFSVNRPEWLMAEQACYYNNYTTVPLYDTLGDEGIEHICQETEMDTVFLAENKVESLLRLRDKLGKLKHLVLMEDHILEEISEKAGSLGLHVSTVAELEEFGRENPAEPDPPKPSDLCTICYTSGTTGKPKGVMMTHSAIVAAAAGVLALCGLGNRAQPNTKYSFSLSDQDVHLSYLPLAHIYERDVSTVLTAAGAAIGFYQGDVAKLMDDIAELHPTIFVSVPRLLNRVYDKVMANVGGKPWLMRALFRHALSSKMNLLKGHGYLRHWIYDRLVFSAIKQRLGGCVKAIVTGAAPIAPETVDFLRVCFSCDVYEGYGLTETAAGSAVNSYGDWVSGQVGAPVPCNEIKLVDIPEMGYTSNGPGRARGEICIRGPNCFVGYYKNPEKTTETLTRDGWVLSGDVGEWDEEGRLRIIDRKKSLFKLAQGEYIAPEKIENVISRIPCIEQCYVEGDSLKASLVAIIVPDEEALTKWAKGVWKDQEFDFEKLCAEPKAREMLLHQIELLGSKGAKELKGFEVPKDIHVESEAFSIANGLLTPTFKIKRFQAKTKYQKVIGEMYAKLS